MAILISTEIVVLFSITVTLRQLLGWIFLHEQFIGNKVRQREGEGEGDEKTLPSISDHRSHSRPVRFLVSRAQRRFSVQSFSPRFDHRHLRRGSENDLRRRSTPLVLVVVTPRSLQILVHAFVKEVNHTKLTLVMINVSFFGTLFLWPLVLLFHLTGLETFESTTGRAIFLLLALISALGECFLCRSLPFDRAARLVFNLLTIVSPFEYISIGTSAYFLLVIPSSSSNQPTIRSACFHLPLSVLDRYLFGMNFSPLVIAAIICSFAGVLLALIPKQCFQASETGKMKQALALLNREPTSNVAALPTGTSSAFEEIRAQRRIRNALLYNDGKT